MENQQKDRESIKEKILKDFHSLKDMTVKYANLARRKLDLVNLKKNRDKQLLELAKSLYEKHKYDDLTIPGFEESLKNIDKKTKEIERLEKEIKKTDTKTESRSKSKKDEKAE